MNFRGVVGFGMGLEGLEKTHLRHIYIYIYSIYIYMYIMHYMRGLGFGIGGAQGF